MVKYIKIKASKEQFTVSDEDYLKEVDAKRHRMQYHGKCVCPLEVNYRCNGDCDNCCYQRAGDECSFEEKNEAGELVSIEETKAIGTIRKWGNLYIPKKETNQQENLPKQPLTKKLSAKGGYLESEVEQLVTDRILLEKLISRLCELDPDGKQMIALWQEEPYMSGREMARRLGRKERTFADQLKKIREELKKIRSY